ncbi:MAG: serine O-acetyltransferase EpsC [Sphaerochaetaceae bacterium]
MEKKENRYAHYLDHYLASFDRSGQANFISFRPIPSMVTIEGIVEDFMELFYPGRSGRRALTNDCVREELAKLLEKIGLALEKQIYLAFYHTNPLSLGDEEVVPYQEISSKIVGELFRALPDLRRMMKEDALSAYEGDPAATSVREVLIAYPGVRALTIHRIAHFLYLQNVPLVPRMLGETVHKQTGIDIHPGAEIGRCLFIDHGTGVVIGETSKIGNQVKIYQGVTLGALSFPKDTHGDLIRGVKRHPTLKDRVTIYANATILGDITIGENSIIGSNTWIREDVPANRLVQNKEPESITRKLKVKDADGKECGEASTPSE